MKGREIIALLVLVVTVVASILMGLMYVEKPVEEVTEHNKIEYIYIPSLDEELLGMRNVQERKEYFIETLLPLVLKSNEKVAGQRALLEDITKRTKSLAPDDKQILKVLAKQYRVRADSYEETLDELLVRVNVLPPSLIIAQAAIESGWGTSRFVLEGNNLFGLRNRNGRGMIPNRQRDGEVFWVSIFDDLQACIDYYLWNINTYPVYEELRTIRDEMEQPHDPLVLARGLQQYSELGITYVEKLKKLIIDNELTEYDMYSLGQQEYSAIR
ncbi:MAG: glucosaminidase domain-containing protein [Deltaproteobacteria bacterium]|nr:glucosaminidase domain-containing protein [Deltaproteobacteria bacterium]